MCFARSPKSLGRRCWPLGVVESELTPEQGFSLSRLDETYQAEKWGEDNEAVEREAFLKAGYEDDLRWLGLSQ